MNLKVRFSMIGIGIILFVIITPFLVLYARGFKYDFATHKIIKTGALVVNTNPPKASIFLDDARQKSSTPATIRFLTPKDYEVRIEKDGRLSWSKRLTVVPQFVTWANNNRDAINLFLSQPILGQTWTSAYQNVSKTGDEIFFEDASGKAQLLNVNNGQTKNLGSISDFNLPNLNPAPFQWSNGSKISEMLISKTRVAIPPVLLNTTKYIESNGANVIFLFGSDLYNYDLTNLTLIAKSVASATLASDGIWYAQNNQLKHFDYGRNDSETILANLPTAQKIQILRADSQIFLILDQTLYLVNETLQPIYSPVSFAQWDSTSHTLLYGNTNEIEIYYPNTQKSELILRSLNSISNPILNWAAGYVFFAQGNQIKVIELDGRDQRNIFTIINTVVPTTVFTVSADGKKLYLFNQNKLSEYTIR